MIEVKFSALPKQRMVRHLAAKGELTKEVMAIVLEREGQGIKIDWQFSNESARQKLNRNYREIFADHAQYQKT